MGILDNFERGLERLVNGAFAKAFKSGLQPVEITSALRRELDTRAAVVSRDRILAPNAFTVALAPDDEARLRSLGPTLVEELVQVVQEHARAQGYTFAGGISVDFEPNSRLSQGMVEVTSNTVKNSVRWTPVLEINGRRHHIRGGRAVIGRGSEADITVDDPGISRKHVEVLWDGSKGQARDLGSTNGSSLNGQRLGTALLAPDSVIDIGSTRIVFRVLAQARDQSASGGRR